LAFAGAGGRVKIGSRSPLPRRAGGPAWVGGRAGGPAWIGGRAGGPATLGRAELPGGCGGAAADIGTSGGASGGALPEATSVGTIESAVAEALGRAGEDALATDALSAGPPMGATGVERSPSVNRR
jgi:hypothetical protein